MQRQNSYLRARPCPAPVLIRNFSKLELEEPLEVNGNVHPRYMVALDRIRLIDAAKASKAKAMLAFAFEPSKSPSAKLKCSAVSEAEMLRFSASEQTNLYEAKLHIDVEHNPVARRDYVIIAPMRVIGDTVARWSLVVLIALMPLFVIPTAWASVVQSKLVLAALLIAIILVFYVIARLAQGTLIVPRDAVFYTSALLPIAYFVSALASGSGAGSYVSGVGMQDTVASMAILFASLACVATLFAGGLRNVLVVFLAFLGGCSVVVIFQIARLFAPGWLTLGGVLSGSASSIVGSWHDLGILSALVVFFAITLFNSPFLGKRMSTIFLPIIGALALFLTFVIGLSDIWYALGALLILFSFYAAFASGHAEKQVQKNMIHQAIVAFFVGIIALIFGFSGNIVYVHLPNALQIVQAEVRPSWGGTFAVGEKVFAGNGSIFGAGPNSFQNAWGKFKPASINETDFWSTDFNQGVGFIPTSFVTAGALGMFAWLLLFLAVAVHIVRFVRDKTAGDRTLHACLLGSILFLLGFHIVYTPTLAISLILFFLLGLVVALATADRSRIFALPLRFSSLAGALTVTVFLVVCAAMLFACVVTARAALSDLMIQKAAFDFNTDTNVERALVLVQRALVIYPQNDQAHRAAVELGLQQLQKLIASGNKSDADALKNALSQTIASGLAAVSIDSTDYQNWLSLAGAYQNLASAGVEGAYQNAIAAYEKAAAANPTNPLPLIGAGQVALAEGDATSSVNYLNAAILLKNNLAVAYYLRSQGEGQMGNLQPAIDDAKNAISLAQQDPLGWYNLGTLFYISGDYQNAATALSQAVSLNNTYSNALFMLSLTFNKLNDHDRAILAMQKVVELNPTNGTATSTLASLIAASSTPITSTSTTRIKAR